MRMNKRRRRGEIGEGVKRGRKESERIKERKEVEEGEKREGK